MDPNKIALFRIDITEFIDKCLMSITNNFNVDQELKFLKQLINYYYRTKFLCTRKTENSDEDNEESVSDLNSDNPGNSEPSDTESFVLSDENSEKDFSYGEFSDCDDKSIQCKILGINSDDENNYDNDQDIPVVRQETINKKSMCHKIQEEIIPIDQLIQECRFFYDKNTHKTNDTDTETNQNINSISEAGDYIVNSLSPCFNLSVIESSMEFIDGSDNIDYTDPTEYCNIVS
ncbi:hypothetical protein QJ850_gp768 [Acanthamoeba polyphaga mimivirus]|uniref:Uncharacterized protein n=1 Tax=Acanthamoeba polyphaga mimivirus Kroon TaxID=3069720 RepID=A0A0G2Y9Y3_9VIRU|nr:hypothetical protein QJ850_gp768 [Acanthamoeba polyphaga mimivirus]AKI79931.1 hypothetical protein [Acanthamoeba polyphaga mimivirus Kroon]